MLILNNEIQRLSLYKQLAILVMLICCGCNSIYDEKTEIKPVSSEYLGTFKTIDNGFFSETLVLQKNGVCYYSMTSDATINGKKFPKNVKGKYYIQNNMLTFEIPPDIVEKREIRKINGICTLWKSYAIARWNKSKSYNIFGIMTQLPPKEIEMEKRDGVSFIPKVNNIDRLLNNNVAGVKIKKNDDDIISYIPPEWQEHFKGLTKGKYFIERKIDSNLIKCYEFNYGPNGEHIRQGIVIDYFTGTSNIESIISYENQVFNGPSVSFYSNGRIRFKQYFKHFFRCGLCQQWNSSGKLTAQAEYVNGEPLNGTSREVNWKAEGNSQYILVKYKNGKRVSFQPCDEEGNIISVSSQKL